MNKVSYIVLKIGLQQYFSHRCCSKRMVLNSGRSCSRLINCSGYVVSCGANHNIAEARTNDEANSRMCGVVRVVDGQ